MMKPRDTQNKKHKNSPYNPAFVKKIKASKKEVEEGNYIVLDPGKSLWENLNKR